jgi:hypothetical protein
MCAFAGGQSIFDGARQNDDRSISRKTVPLLVTRACRSPCRSDANPHPSAFASPGSHLHPPPFSSNTCTSRKSAPSAIASRAFGVKPPANFRDHHPAVRSADIGEREFAEPLDEFDRALGGDGAKGGRDEAFRPDADGQRRVLFKKLANESLDKSRLGRQIQSSKFGRTTFASSDLNRSC